MGVQPAAAQNTHVVDDDGFASAADCNALTAAFMTIGAAEAASGPGDTITVCPGLYPGVFIDVNNLTVTGAQVGVDARTRTFVAGNESIIQDACGPVQIVSNNVVLDGFTVQGASLPDPCFLAGIWTNPASAGNSGGYQIRNNIVQNNIHGMFLNSGCANATLVNRNLIQNNNNAGASSGNGIVSGLGLCNATIDINKFSGHTSGSVLIAPGSQLTISNNELVAGSSESIALADVTNGTVSGNVSVGSTDNFGTIILFGGNSNIDVNGNTLFNGVRAIRVADTGAGQNSDIEAHFNCIDGNSMAGLQVDAGAYPLTPLLNAENNWWGSPNGPTHSSNPGGNGDAIIAPDDNVDFIPFLNSCDGGPSQATGGGQITVSSRATFGFNAKAASPSNPQQSRNRLGHLNYRNHATGADLQCQVIEMTSITPTMAEFRGACTTRSTAPTFRACVKDGGEPGQKSGDEFKIEYPDDGPSCNGEGGVISRGNIQIK